MKDLMSNRERLKLLLEEAGITQLRASELIAETTTVPCSVRSVRAWLAEPNKPSARTCPDWAVLALTAAIQSEHALDH